MHEASIVENLLEIVSRYASDGQRLRRIDVRVGLLTGVSPEAMQFYFEILRENTPASEAELAVSLAPLRGRCAGCGRTSELPELDWSCPACGAASLSFLNGDELDVVSVEVDDAAGD